MSIVPIADLQRRMPTHGRIRIGKKVQTRNGKSAPSKIDAFRFTSADGRAIEEIAALYGGDPHRWADAPVGEQYEVFTTAKEISIALPPDPLGGTPIYEHWSGGGCLRRCNGVVCTTPVKTPDGAEYVEVPCVCETEGKLTCKAKTRLTVIMRGVRFGGGWRLDTGSDYAAKELPGMVDLILSLQDRAIVRGLLRLEERMKVTGGQTHKFVVPTLALDADLEALVSGAMGLGGLAPASDVAALGAGGGGAPGIERPVVEPVVEGALDDEPDWFDPQLIPGHRVDAPLIVDDIIDAEIVEEEPGIPGGDPVASGGGAGSTPATGAGSSSTSRRSADPTQTKLVLLCADVAARLRTQVAMDIDDETFRHAAAWKVSEGRTESSKDLSAQEKSRVIDGLVAVVDGEKGLEPMAEMVTTYLAKETR